MVRKRAGKLSYSRRVSIEEKKYVKPVKKSKKKYWIALALIGIFCLVLFFNSYFNYTSGTAFNPQGDSIGTRFFLSGPDPYYNMRTCTESIDSGYYRFVTEEDPLLNYPVGHYGSSRPPLFNMIAMGSAHLVNGITNIGIEDSLGWCMLFLPAIYGALLVFPVYGIGKELFHRKAGLISAFFIAIIPLHIGSGHGSAFSLFDHDSFILLLFTVVFYFLLKALKEENKTKSTLFAILSGIFIGGIQLTWVNAEMAFVSIALFIVIMLFIDIFRKNRSIKTPLTLSIILGTGFLISLPYDVARNTVFNFPLYTFAVSLVVILVYLIIKKLDLPWIVSLPLIGIFSGVGLGFLYMINSGIIKLGSVIGGPIYAISSIIFGEGIYGSEVSLTIGEAHTYGISQTVMGFGPSMYWLGLVGFVLFIWKTHKEKWKSYHIFFIMMFIIYLWLTGTAGRFLNDMIPCIALFAGFTIFVLIEKINYKKMIRTIKSLGGFKGIRKGVKFIHIVGILFISFLVIFPNVFLTLDAATPPEMDREVFGEDFTGVYGNSLFQQIYWVDACSWISHQDTEIKEPENRPGVISWWDYGFYLSSMSEHPTVADNFQEGIPPASNFLTSQSEKEAVSILIIRIVEGTKEPAYYGEISDDCIEVFEKHLGNESKNITNILNYPEKYAPSFDQPVAPEWGYSGMKISVWNAMYQDSSNIIMKLSDEEVTNLYHDMMKATGYSIRYGAIEQRDLTSIFGVFPFLADKGTHGYVTMEDDFYVTEYVDTNTNKGYSIDELNNMTKEEVDSLSLDTRTRRKEGYYNSMAFSLYYGPNFGNQVPDNRAPTYGLKHFVPVYLSPYIVIAKYYEGAKISGTITAEGNLYSGSMVFVLDEYGIPHDSCIVDNGKVNLISPPGNVTLGLFMMGELVGQTKLDSPITEEEALREVECDKTFSIDINMSSVAVSFLGDIEQNTSITITSQTYPNFILVEENITNATYHFSNLIPDTYKFVVRNETSEIFSGNKFLRPNENTYEISLGGI